MINIPKCRRLPQWLPTILCLVAILWLTLSPAPVGDMDLPLFPGADKVVHALMFFGLTMTGVYDLWRFKGYVKPLKRHVLLLSVASIIVGIVVEILQYIMSMGRSFDLPDIAADCLGAIVVFVLYRY